MVMCPKTVKYMANSADPDQMPHSVASDLGLFATYLSVPIIRVTNITKTFLYNFDPLKPHFYIVKLGFRGVYIILLISAKNIDCGYALELPL